MQNSKISSLERRRWFGSPSPDATGIAFAGLVTLLATFAASPAAAELYKYINEDGVTVLDSHVPARYVKDGYTILSLDGRVMEVVERALSELEIRERDRTRVADEIRERNQRERQVADQNLLRIYGTPEDVIRARDTKLLSIKGFISVSDSNLQRLEAQKRAVETELADIERSGGQIPADRIDYMRGLELRILQSEREIAEKMREIDQLGETYAADLKRVRELQAAKPRT